MLQRESGWKWDSPLFPWYSSRNRLQRQELDEIVRAGNETENARSAGLGTITCKVVDPSLRLLDRAEGVPFHSISTEDAMFAGKRKVRARIVLQPCREDTDPVYNARRILDKIAKITVDLRNERIFKLISLEDLDVPVIESPDLFHPQDVRDRHMHQHLLQELRWKPFGELRDDGRGHGPIQSIPPCHHPCSELGAGFQHTTTLHTMRVGPRRQSPQLMGAQGMGSISVSTTRVKARCFRLTPFHLRGRG